MKREKGKKVREGKDGRDISGYSRDLQRALIISKSGNSIFAIAKRESHNASFSVTMMDFGGSQGRSDS